MVPLRYDMKIKKKTFKHGSLRQVMLQIFMSHDDHLPLPIVVLDILRPGGVAIYETAGDRFDKLRTRRNDAH